MNRSRLDAETLRDTVLLASGRLDDSMFGPPIKHFIMKPGIHVTPEADYDRYDVDAPKPAGEVYIVIYFALGQIPCWKHLIAQTLPSLLRYDQLRLVLLKPWFFGTINLSCAMQSILLLWPKLVQHLHNEFDLLHSDCFADCPPRLKKLPGSIIHTNMD